MTFLGSTDCELERDQQIDGSRTESDKVDHESRDKTLETLLETRIEIPRSTCEEIVFIHRVIDDLMSEFVCNPLTTNVSMIIRSRQLMVRILDYISTVTQHPVGYGH